MRDYRVPHAAISGSIQTFLDQHPDAFEALLYRADHAQPESVSTGDVVGSFESNERTLEYKDPEDCKALIIPEMGGVSILLDGTGTDGNMVDPIVMLVSADDVPQQSIIQYQEYTGTDEIRQVNLYVARGEQIGSGPGVGTKLFCLPMQAFEDLT